MRKRFTIAVAAVSAIGALFAASAGAATVSGSNGPFTATLHAGTHHPKINKAWPIRVTATENGRSVRAAAFYQFLYNGQAVSSQAVCPNSGTTGCKNWGFQFTGHYSDFLLFPPQSKGFPLTLRVVVSLGKTTLDSHGHPVPHGRTVYLPYAVQTHS